MKKMLVLLFIFSASIAFSFAPLPGGGNPNDSLLFDGANFIPIDIGHTCKVKVKYVSGSAKGGVEHEIIESICGDTPDTGFTYRVEFLKPGNFLHIGDSLETGPDSYLTLELEDGSEAKIGPNSILQLYPDFCDHPTICIFQGKMWMKVKRILGGAKYEVKTQRAVIGHRGTEFAVEISGEQDIVKCYEGSIDVKINKINYDKGEAIKQLTKDLQAGKITQQEFADKVKALNVDPTKINTSVILGAGNMCTVSGMLSDPVPIEASSDDRWFETSFPDK